MATTAKPQSTMATTAEEFKGARAEITAKIAVVEGQLEVLRDVPIGRRDWAAIQTADQSLAALVKELGTIEAQQAGPEPVVTIDASGPGAGPEGEPPQPLLRVTTVTGFGDASKADLVDKIFAGGGGARTAVMVAQHLPDGAAPSPDPADQERGRCYSRGGQMVTRPEQPRQPTSQEEADEMAQDALMGGVPLRIDLLEELCRIAASGDYDTVILQCAATSDPGSVAAAFQSKIPVGFLDDHVPDANDAIARLGGPINVLADLATLDGVVSVVDAEGFWPAWNSLSTMQDDPMGDEYDEEDTRSHVYMFAEQIEAAGMVVVAGTTTAAGAMEKESICTAIKVLNPKGTIVMFDDVTADDVMSAPGRNRFMMLGGGWTPGQGPQAVAAAAADGVVRMRRDDADPADAMSVVAPVNGGFVYTRRTPFHPERFHDWCERYFFTQAFQFEQGADEDEGDEGESEEEMDSEDAADAEMGDDDDDDDDDVMAARTKVRAAHSANWKTAHTGQLLRTKGVCWIAGYHGMAISLEQMGAFLALDLESPWFAALRPVDWPEVYPDVDVPAMTTVCAQYPEGDRRIELEVLGHGLSQATFEAELDACLLTPAELEKLDGPVAMAKLKDPFHMISERSKILHASGPIDLSQDGVIDTAEEEVPGYSFVR